MSDRSHRESGWRATAFAVALFAVTLNFLQPLAHAALIRDGAPSTLWSVFCNASARDAHNEAPIAAGEHECCLGFAHATSFTPPAAVPVAIEPASAAVQPLQPIDLPTAVGIRDGPHRPRGPPPFV
jgi:hypothetical protein